MTRPGQFRKSLWQFAAKSKGQAEKVRRGAIIKLFNAVVLTTPVDTGRLRANWRIGVNKPELNPREEFDKNGQKVMPEILAATASSVFGQTVFLTNNLPYAMRIEYDGWSREKAPRGMVRINVARFEELIRTRAKLNAYAEGTP